MKNNKGIYLALIAFLTFTAGTASATLILETPNGGGQAGENVNFGDAEGMTILSESPGPIVVFESNESLVSNGGQCCLNASDGNLNFVTFFLQDTGLGFAELYFNLQGGGPVGDDVVEVVLQDQFGTNFTFDPVTLGSGSNWFYGYGIDDQVIASVSITANLGVSMRDLQQVRLGSACVVDCDNGGGGDGGGGDGGGGDGGGGDGGGGDGGGITTVPEPSTLALLGLGLAGMGMTRRKKKV